MIAVDRTPRLLLRLEGIVLAAGALAVYLHLDYGILALVALLVAVDLSLVGFIGGPRIGTLTYNLAHTTALPLALGAIGVVTDGSTAVQVALAWLAHIGIDRALGLGLKYPSAFKDTHLQRGLTVDSRQHHAHPVRRFTAPSRRCVTRTWPRVRMTRAR